MFSRSSILGRGALGENFEMSRVSSSMGVPELIPERQRNDFFCERRLDPKIVWNDVICTFVPIEALESRTRGALSTRSGMKVFAVFVFLNAVATMLALVLRSYAECMMPR